MTNIVDRLRREKIESLRELLASANAGWQDSAARLAATEALLRDIYSYAEDQGMETLMDMIDTAFAERNP